MTLTFMFRNYVMTFILISRQRDEKGRKMTETPKDLYQKYLNFSVILPFNDTAWPLQLPPTFLSDLGEKLRRRITSVEDFCMPDLSTLSTKSKQLKGLCEVRNTTVRHYMKMEEDIYSLKEILKLQQKNKVMWSICV